VIDFGVESAGWLEVTVSGLTQQDLQWVTMSTGEGNLPTFVGGYKTGQPAVYGSVLRLETNGELYEGVRYGFFSLTQAPRTPFTITGIRLVAQAKAVNYTGSFEASGDPLLDKIWYTGAYTIRVLLLPSYMGSVLVERGDRISWTGDAFVSQGTLLSFASDTSIVLQNLRVTSCPDCCQGIATYCLLFVLSVVEYWEATGDASALREFTPVITLKLEHARELYSNPQGLRFVGWDDRTGSGERASKRMPCTHLQHFTHLTRARLTDNHSPTHHSQNCLLCAGFANNTTPETQNMYRMLAIRCWSAFAGAAASPAGLNNATLSAHYKSYSETAIAELRNTTARGTGWWQGWGVHAGAEALNAGFPTALESAGIYSDTRQGDIVVLPSLSHFNQYFILTASAMFGVLDRAVEQVRRFWGADIALGATTFFEVGHPGLINSGIPVGGPPPLPGEQNGWTLLCADWSTGAVQFLSRWVLGVRSLAPGFKRALLAPHVADGMSGVIGEYPVPGGGVIFLNLTRGSVGGTASSSSSSDCVILTVGLPRVGVSEGGLIQLSSKTLARVLRGSRKGAGVRAINTVTATTTEGKEEEEDLDDDTFLDFDAQLDTFTVSSINPEKGGKVPVLGLRVESTPTTPLLLERGSDTGAVSPRSRALLFEVPPAGTPPYESRDPATPSYSTHAICPGPLSTTAHRILQQQQQQQGTARKTSRGGPFPPPSWPGRFISSDSTTQGDWVRGGYGKDGFVLFAYRGVGFDEVSLPSYVESVTPEGQSVGFLAARVSWVNDTTTDTRALKPPSGGGGASLGAVSARGGPTFPIDIVLNKEARDSGKSYKLSVYMVDFGPTPWGSGSVGEARTQEVCSFSGYPDLNPMTQRQYVSNFSGGVWMSYEMVGSVRFRASTIRGDMCVISAITFDPL